MPQTDLGFSLQYSARQPDELSGLSPKLGEEKDQKVLVKEEEQTDFKPERYVPMGMSATLAFWFRFHDLGYTHVDIFLSYLVLVLSDYTEHRWCDNEDL